MNRDQYKCFYGSSYDRGLEHLLKMWPDVKKAVPQATLEIAYGWQLFVIFYGDNPASMSWKAKMDEMMKHEGITHHGRLSQPDIAELMFTCGVWTYPTHFGEVSCINAMKAQAFGAIPVTMNYAALQTTVQYGIKVDGDIYEPEVQENYKKQLIVTLTSPEGQRIIRKPMMNWAQKKFPWSNVAKQWDEEFKRDDLKEAMDLLIEKKPEVAKFMPVQLQEKHGLNITY